MVVRTLLVLVTCIGLFGCGSTADNPAPRTVAKTKEEQIAEIRSRTDMPDHIKEQTIQNLSATNAPPSGK